MLTRLILASILLAASSAKAQVGKWVDKDGQVFYGDRPPAAKPVKEKPISRGSVSTADSGPFQAAPAKWAAKKGGPAAGAGAAPKTPISRAREVAVPPPTR